MSENSNQILPETANWLAKLAQQKEHPVMQKLRADTAKMPNSQMQIAVEQAQFMQFLIKTNQTTNALEIGTFTGYSALATALALPEHGKLTCLDISEEFTSKAIPFWKEAKIDHKINLIIAPATESLKKLKAENQKFDFVFIDADKNMYPKYFEQSLEMLSNKGIIAIDNIFRNGDAIKPNPDPDSITINKLTNEIYNNPKLEVTLDPIGDGLLLVRKAEHK